MPFADAEERREYNRQWRLRPENLERDRERCRLKSQAQRQSRNELLSDFPCLACGEPDSDLIDWHHVDPDSKKFCIKGSGGINENAWWLEVLKCIPLCCNCHRKIHKEKLCLLPIQR